MSQTRERIVFPPVPERWQDDLLSRFFATGDYNILSVFVRYAPVWKLFEDIDDAYDTLVGNLGSTPYETSVFLLQCSHSAHLAALRLVLSTQFVDAYPLLRSTLEYAIYSLYFRDHEDKFTTWSERHRGTRERKAARSLNLRKMLDYLATKDSRLGDKVKWLYESTIDMGAHPNPAAVASAYKLHVQDEDEYHEVRYYGGEELGWKLALQQAALVGISGIQTASCVFPERARILGIPQKLDTIHGQMALLFHPSDVDDAR